MEMKTTIELILWGIGSIVAYGNNVAIYFSIDAMGQYTEHGELQSTKGLGLGLFISTSILCLFVSWFAVIALWIGLGKTDFYGVMGWWRIYPCYTRKEKQIHELLMSESYEDRQLAIALAEKCLNKKLYKHIKAKFEGI